MKLNHILSCQLDIKEQKKGLCIGQFGGSGGFSSVFAGWCILHPRVGKKKSFKQWSVSEIPKVLYLMDPVWVEGETLR